MWNRCRCYGNEKLKWMCEKVGINNTQETNQMAIQLATFLESQQHIGVESENIMVEAFAPKKERSYGKS